MSSLLIANCSPTGSRVALMEEGRLAELFIEQPARDIRVGNIYKGRVTNVVPGMECAFVDIGGSKDLFLPLSDINHETPEESVSELERSPSTRRSSSGVSIQELVKPGDEVLVQISKEPMGTKGPRGTTFLTLPGRYLVLMPETDHIGVSRRLSDPVDVARLQEIIMGIRPPGMGVIIRTVTLNRSKQELESDLKFLMNLWSSIQKQAKESPTPSMVYEVSSLLLKVVRDLLGPETENFLIDSKEEYERVLNYCKFLPEQLIERIQYAQGNPFQEYGVEQEIHRAKSERVSLPSGGYIIIQETEALVSIDVNTGSYTGNDELESTVYNTNLEAASEIARQLRLRNLGGIVVVDFIDMLEMEHRDAVSDKLSQGFQGDKTRIRILPISEFGTLQLTRQRIGPSLSSILFNRCPYCRGRGKVNSKEFMCSRIYREIRSQCLSRPSPQKVQATCHPTLASVLLERDEEKFKELEEETNTKIYIRGDSKFHYEQFVVS
ncbi:Rne/Rng family ribonuclease [bacterium]|nr:Rne/Rng family ribonuclease [bacterium]